MKTAVGEIGASPCAASEGDILEVKRSSKVATLWCRSDSGRGCRKSTPHGSVITEGY